MGLHSTTQGTGQEILLVHGGATDGPLAWFAQAPLAERWRLRIVDRAGYGQSAELSAGEDIELDARLLAESLDEPVHVVGHSSGAVVAMLLGAAVPGAVRSLTLVEPPSYRFIDDPGVQALADGGDALWRRRDLSDRDWMREFFVTFGGEDAPEEVVAMVEPHIPTFRGFVRTPWEIAIPVTDLRDATYPKLVVSGGHDDAYERLNDAIAAAIDARRAVVPGAGHEVQMTGAPFNDALDAFLTGISSTGS